MSNLTVSVNVVSSPCKINGGKAIDVEFGDVNTFSLKSVKAIFPVTINCSGQTLSGGLGLVFNGDTTNFSSTALKTSVDGLGITITPSSGTSAGQGELTPDTYYDLATLGLTATTGTVNLVAGLVSDGSTTLSGGEFTASATLVLQMV